jgi:hypothetical protein
MVFPFARHVSELVFGVLIAVGLYLTYVGWLAKPASPSVKNSEDDDAG